MGHNQSHNDSKNKETFDNTAELDRSSGFHFLEVHAPSVGLSWTFVCAVLVTITVCYGIYRCFVAKCHIRPSTRELLEAIAQQQRQQSTSNGSLRGERRFAHRQNRFEELELGTRFLPPLMSSVPSAPSAPPVDVSTPTQTPELSPINSPKPNQKLKNQRNAASQVSYISQC